MCLYVKDSKCPHGQAVKTSPSHGGIWGSIPHGGTKKSYTNVWDFLLPQRGIVRFHARNYVARTPEHWADAHLCKWTCPFHYSVTSFLTIPMGVPIRTQIEHRFAFFFFTKNWRSISAPLCLWWVVPFENLRVQGGYRLPTALSSSAQCDYEAWHCLYGPVVPFQIVRFITTPLWCKMSLQAYSSISIAKNQYPIFDKFRLQISVENREKQKADF